VCDVNVAEGWFTFMLVEYTQKHIVVPLKPADGTGKVNIEVDVLGKYVERSMSSVLERLARVELVLGLGDGVGGGGGGGGGGDHGRASAASDGSGSTWGALGPPGAALAQVALPRL
jgi:hypothetical protein